MLNPAFFTENQAGINPHDKLNDLESARIIISHVTEGLKLAEKYNLPREIKEFITTHHGAGLAKYFYIHYKNEHPDEAGQRWSYSVTLGQILSPANRLFL